MKKLAFLFLTFVLATTAQAADSLQANVDYILLDPPQPERVQAGKIEVMEFFNFSCPHCFRLQKPFAEWKKALSDPEDIVIVHQPVIFQRYNGHYARVYYTLSALGIADEFSPKVYRAIHSEKTLINSKDRFLDWLEETADIAPEKGNAIYESFSVVNRANRALAITAGYNVDSTPQIAVAGKYLLNARLSGSYGRMLETLTALIERERQLRQKN